MHADRRAPVPSRGCRAATGRDGDDVGKEHAESRGAQRGMLSATSREWDSSTRADEARCRDDSTRGLGRGRRAARRARPVARRGTATRARMRTATRGLGHDGEGETISTSILRQRRLARPLRPPCLHPNRLRSPGPRPYPFTTEYRCQGQPERCAWKPPSSAAQRPVRAVAIVASRLSPCPPLSARPASATSASATGQRPLIMHHSKQSRLRQ